MVEIEIDGEKIKAEPGSSLLQVALDSGKPIPHFCYHKKLSITASCRMCLVEVDKTPKLVPACATPVTEGMLVHTDSVKVIEARKAVMEFLLINHPLDCPVCDQGGECLLQDYSVGIWHFKSPFYRGKTHCFRKKCRAADFHAGNEPLYPVHPLCPFRRRDRWPDGIRYGQPG